MSTAALAAAHHLQQSSVTDVPKGLLGAAIFITVLVVASMVVKARFGAGRGRR